MNERIYDLAEQAEIYANELIDKDRKHPNQYPRYFAEKFAELIVKECAEVGHDSVEDGDDLDAIMNRVHNNILKHFGVEE